jgi:subtilisin family serine protease
MSLNHEARLEKLLARHRDAVLSQGANGTSALHRRDQLLVAGDHADRAVAAAERWTRHREDLPEAGVSRLHLHPRAQVDVGELAARLREHPDGPISASPNHLLRGEPDYSGGPFDAPRPYPALPRPISQDPSARRAFIGILDTGISAHPWFSDTDWFAQVTADQLDPLPERADYELETQTGHGTFVAGILLRQAPNAFLLVERVLDDDGVCDELKLLHGLSRLHRRLSATGESLDVLNLSLGGYTLDDEPSPLIGEALGRFGQHTVIVVAAGNHGSNRPFWPAALKNCVAVAALDPDGSRRAEFSNHGWWVDACAVGQDVAGPFLTDTTPDGRQFTGYAQWSGTSFATPRVAGAIAGLAAVKHLSAPDAAQFLLDPATRPHRADFGVVVQ